MSKLRLLIVTLAMVTIGGVGTWLFAAAHHGVLPDASFEPKTAKSWKLTGPDATAARAAIIGRARALVPTVAASSRADLTPGPLTASLPDPLTCRFLKERPTGTTAKFDCVLASGEVVKVKYGRNAEIHAEAAATRLIAALGFAADRIDIVSRVRCYGCPRFPFLTMQLLALTASSSLLDERGLHDGFTDFEWTSVERKFPAPSVETADREGFAWFELERSTIPRAEIDAFRLLAIFLAHWDNKSENQRVVCLGDNCETSVLIMQDVGATFGPTKVNLEHWRTLPVWRDARRCLVSMRHMPFSGATFPDVTISEEGRALLASRLAALDDAAVRMLFADARFPEFYAATDDERDLAAWTNAFRHRVDQIVNAGPCPATGAPTQHQSSALSD